MLNVNVSKKILAFFNLSDHCLFYQYRQNSVADKYNNIMPDYLVLIIEA